MSDHKRRARWRLLGAILLTGSVAAVAPFLLEEEARPLARDLIVEMPAIKMPVLTPVSEPAESSTAPAVAPAEPVGAQPAPTTASAAPLTNSKVPSTSSIEPPKSAAPSSPKKDAKAKGPSILVQVGAYGSRQAAVTVQKRLESAGHRSSLEAIKTSSGQDRFRVRVGPFESRESATEFRDRAKSQGYDAVLVTVK